MAKKGHETGDPNALNVKLRFLYRGLDINASDISSFLLTSIPKAEEMEYPDKQMDTHSFSQTTRT